MMNRLKADVQAGDMPQRDQRFEDSIQAIKLAMEPWQAAAIGQMRAGRAASRGARLGPRCTAGSAVEQRQKRRAVVDVSAARAQAAQQQRRSSRHGAAQRRVVETTGARDCIDMQRGGRGTDPLQGARWAASGLSCLGRRKPTPKLARSLARSVFCLAIAVSAASAAASPPTDVPQDSTLVSPAAPSTLTLPALPPPPSPPAAAPQHLAWALRPPHMQ
ncbi:hypothetical protein SVAN01_03355 [Stagonosporopsis vannaccii]|nr:hypothetical protein SVAN01_03355 [Stagonosporopsis vannaccii]